MQRLLWRLLLWIDRRILGGKDEDMQADTTFLLTALEPYCSQYNLDVPLMYLVAIAESGGNPWAYRYEAKYYDVLTRKNIPEKHVYPPTLLSERVGRATSWGLFQIMGQTAREHGFKHQYLTVLLDKKINIEMACKIFAAKLLLAKGEIHKALTYWNGSPQYADRILTLYNKAKELPSDKETGNAQTI